MSRRLPDFIIGGAPRSGTTWLYTVLDRHPQVYLARPKKPEPKFFLVDHVYERGIDYYAHTWFADVPAGRIAGEKSTDYLESAVAAARIHRHLPDVRLVFILREPVDRAYSNYRWTRMNGLETESFATALELEAEREQALPERLKFTRPYSYFSRGLYARLLEPYLSLFPRDQILVMKFEDVIASPRAQMSALHAFLGVAARPDDVEGVGVINPAEPYDPLDEVMRRTLADRYAEPNRHLARLLGPGFHVWE